MKYFFFIPFLFATRVDEIGSSPTSVVPEGKLIIGAPNNVFPIDLLITWYL
jgi:hypothetical protein